MPFDRAEVEGKTVHRKSRKVRLTDQYVQKLKPTGKRQTISDEVCQGLSLRLGVSGTKSWSFMGRDCHKKSRTETIGRYPDISLKAARQKTDQLRQVFASPEVLDGYQKSPVIVEEVTLHELLIEAEKHFRAKKKIWQQRGKTSDASTARQVITTVFGTMLHQPAVELTAQKASALTQSYKPKSKDRTGRQTANGQASRALSYLRTVYNWASNRTPRFQKIGAGRTPALPLEDLSVIHDPSIDDPKITGERDRVLSVEELRCILPHLKVPETTSPDWWKIDLRPVAQRFILLTLARRDEVEAARWGDVNFEEKLWTKRVKGGHQVTHPLSDAAIALLKALPGLDFRKDDDLLFPNQAFGPLGNWNRSKTKLEESSSVENWHRHDLRRTGATILTLLGVPAQVVDTLLSHMNPLSKVSVSPALQSYAKLAKEMKGLPNPLRDAVETLAEAIRAIEEGRL
ncbi:integrase family protein [Tropicimonas sp. TH_r6]|uniref:tyrosine-type recombinase/integrase n=1 Tax=Tropicimonas sp. TH_r6 TaxID=3082085 RepID=UPI002955ACB7|nr:integrase family protein [Tropicimonas sp. TH_r6]MDV7145649.1 integrase family protein [Tropicimonas sp. TH_r6]